jgi:hypothetical protein
MMSMFRAIAVVSLMILPISVLGQTLPNPPDTGPADRPASNSFRGKHCIEVTGGLLSEITSTAEVSWSDVRTKSEANGLLGSIGYTYWLEDDWGITFSAGVSDADATVFTSAWGTSVISAVVVPVLFGAKYQPSRLFNTDTVRPFVSASIGPYSGFASEVRTGLVTVVEARSETVPGTRLAAGVDLLLTKWLKLGFAGGYHFVADFGKRIGSEKNYSSPEFSMSLGVVFGKGKR